MPYFGYARADRKSTSREAITAKLVANLLTEAARGPPHRARARAARPPALADLRASRR